MQGCTFQPVVNPLPQVLPQMPYMKNNLTTIMKTTIDNLINEELKDTETDDGRINPKIIQMLKHSVNLDLSRSNEKIYDRLYKEKVFRDKQYSLLKDFYDHEKLRECTF